MSKSLISLKSIAAKICSGMGDSVGKYQFRIGQHLLSGYRELNLYVNQDFEVKTQILEFDNVIPMPCDFVYQTKVGVLYNGKLAVLTLDRNIRPEKLTQLQSQQQIDKIFCGEYSGDCGYMFYNCYRNGNYLGEMYGHGRGVHGDGFYNINKKNGEIYIGSLFPKDAEFVIEYKSDGISEGLKLVPTETEMVLSYWAKARFYEEKGDLNMASWNEQRYFSHYNKLKRLYNFMDVLYQSSKMNESFSSTNY